MVVTLVHGKYRIGESGTAMAEIPAIKVLLMIGQEVPFFQRHSRLFLGFVSLMNEWPEAIREGTIVIFQGRTSQLSQFCMPVCNMI